MNELDCARPIPLEDLIAYELDELDEATCDPIEEHLFACTACTARLEGLQRLRVAVVEAARRGELMAGVTVDTLAHSATRGVKIRTYELDSGATVACTIAPDEDFVAMRLRVPATTPALDAVDLHVETRLFGPGPELPRLHRDVPIDHAHREVVVLLPGALVRLLPRTLVSVSVHRVDGSEGLGTYHFDHSPWDQRA